MLGDRYIARPKDSSGDPVRAAEVEQLFTDRTKMYREDGCEVRAIKTNVIMF